MAIWVFILMDAKLVHEALILFNLGGLISLVVSKLRGGDIVASRSDEVIQVFPFDPLGNTSEHILLGPINPEFNNLLFMWVAGFQYFNLNQLFHEGELLHFVPSRNIHDV